MRQSCIWWGDSECPHTGYSPTTVWCPKSSSKIGPRRWLCSKAVTGLNRGMGACGQLVSKCIERACSKR